jgi:hypothetical protein
VHDIVTIIQTRGIVAKLKIAVASIALTLALVGCSSTEPQSIAPTSTSSPTPLPTPSATPVSSESTEEAVAPAAEPDRLVITASGFQLLLDDGTVSREFGYFEPIAPVVTELTTLFGQEPEVNTYDGTGSADYDWAGFHMGTDGPAISPIRAEIIIFVTAPEVNGIAIETVDGISVGDPIADLEAANPNDSSRWTRDGGEQLDVTLDSTPITPGETEKMFSVTVTAFPSSGPITQFSAPMKNFE